MKVYTLHTSAETIDEFFGNDANASVTLNSQFYFSKPPYISNPSNSDVNYVATVGLVQNVADGITALSHDIDALGSSVAGKLDKLTNSELEAYGHNGDEQVAFTVTANADASCLVKRTSTGNILLPTSNPTSDYFAVSKKYAESLVTPSLIGSATIKSISVPGVSTYNGAEFTISSSNLNGLYVFTFGNAMNLVPVYNVQTNVQYKMAGMINNGDNTYTQIVLSYGYTGSKLQFYCKQNPFPNGYTAYLYKVKLF